jgi:two-component system, OmpR family, sensor histidine kinase ChvG
LRLRTLLFAVLFFVAALPGISAVFLRVYENALVRQTEAELIAQGATMVALIEESWPGGAQRLRAPRRPVVVEEGSYSSFGSSRMSPTAEVPKGFYMPERPKVDLRTSLILPERPPADPSAVKPDPLASQAADAAAPVLFQTARYTLASIRMTDRNGVIVYGLAEKGGSYRALPEVQAALGGKRMTVLRTNTTYEKRTFLEAFSRGSTLRVHHARPIMIAGKPVGALLLSRSPRGLFLGMYEDRGKIALGASAIFMALLFLVGLLSRGIAKPIDELAAATKGGARGTLDVPETPATAAIEIRQLYANYREMAARIEKRSRYLQDFAAAVSHEFKTPIAGIKGALELLGDHGATMSKAERKRFLTNANADADRLQHLVQRLLDLARADMANAIEGVATILRAPVSRIADAHRSTGFVVDVTVPDDLPAVAVPDATIEAVVETLLENSRQAGARSVQINARRDGQRVSLNIADNGPGVDPGDKDRLFDAFFTSRRSEGGSGLGLAIARSLLAASGGVIELVDSKGGAAFVLSLPVAR